MKHLSLFSGLGGAEQSLIQAGKKAETIAHSDLCGRANRMYEQIWGRGFQLGDMLKPDPQVWDMIGKMEIDLLTGGFPCQPFSQLGSEKGFDDDRFKPAIAMYELVRQMRPKYLLLENVAAILNKKHREGLQLYLELYKSLGYRVSIHNGNPLDLGYIQSRSRVYFALSREDVALWTIPTIDQMTKVKQEFLVDSEAKIGKNCIRIHPKRVQLVWGETCKYFKCVTARHADAHCGRVTWIRQGNEFRSYTLPELCQLFGWDRVPKLKIHRNHSKGVSRSAIAWTFGNSWHVGHAAKVLESLPC